MRAEWGCCRGTGRGAPGERSGCGSRADGTGMAVATSCPALCSAGRELYEALFRPLYSPTRVSRCGCAG